RPPGQVPYLNLPGMVPVTPEPTQPGDKGSKAPSDDPLQQRDRELKDIRSEQKRTRETETQLRREIERISEDRRRFNQQLIDLAARMRGVEQQITAIEHRLAPLDDEEYKLRTSLEGRREIIARVLAALQRVGRNPPPALLVQPDDALQSVRAAMLFAT